MPPRFHLRVFGPPLLLGPTGKPLRLRTKKQLCLLVYLVLNRDSPGVLRGRLVDLLWPDVPEQRGRHSLSQGLTAIRNLLGPDAVPSGGGRLSIRSPIQTDLDVISQPDGQVGDVTQPLEDLEDGAGVDFAHWVDASRQHLLSAARSELLRAFHEARGLGQTELVYGLATQLFRVDPVNDTAVQTLTERALLAGDTGSAIALLRDFLTRARQGADGVDHERVRKLLERIESGAHPRTDSRPAARRGQASERFVGRAEEVRKLEAMWQQVREGSLQTCLITGVAGIGKTSLLRRFATSIATRGNLALVVRCEEIGTAVPFAVLADLIEELGKDPSLGATDPHWLAEASRIAPALKAKYPGLPAPDSASGEAIRLRVAEAFFRMLETVAEGAPLLIAIDDLQHLDHASRDVLHVLMRRLHDSPAMIVVAARREGFTSSTSLDRRSPEFWEWQATVEIPSLDAGEARMLAKQLTEDLVNCDRYDEILTSVTQLADGNPYFLESLISDWHAHGDDSLAATASEGDMTGAKWRPPDALRLTFSRQYEGLGPTGRQVLELLAVSGRGMVASELGATLGVATAEASHVLWDIIQRGVLRLEGDAVSFKNELHRAFVYYAMSDESRRYHHARLARALMTPSGDAQLHRALEASHHFVRAGMPQDAMSSALAGAEAAVAHGAPQEAERALRKTSDLVTSPPNKAALLLGEALNQQGLYSDALESLATLTAATCTQPERSKLAALRAEAMVRGRIGDEREIQKAVQRGLREARLAGDSTQVLKIFQTAAELAVDQGNAEDVAEAESEAMSMVGKQERSEVQAYAQMTAGFCLWARGRFADGYAHLTSSATVLEQIGHASLVRALNGRAICAFAIGEFDIAIETYDRALFFAERTGDYPAACNIAGNAATLFTDLGALEEAERQRERALEFERLAPDNRYSPKTFNNAASLSIVQGEFADAARWLEKAETALRRVQLVQGRAVILLTRADYHLATGSDEEALQLIASAEVALPRPSSRSTDAYNTGRVRLPEYRTWRTRNERIEGVPLHDDDFSIPISMFVELAAFREWLAERDGVSPAERPNAEDLVRATGLEGVKRLLRVVGMYPSGNTP